MLNRFYYFRKEIQILLSKAAKESSSKRVTFKLKTYEMSKSDWRQINVLRLIFSTFEQATLKLQGDIYHTVGLTIPYVAQALMAIEAFDTPEFEAENPLLALGIKDASKKILKYYPLRGSNIDRLKHFTLQQCLILG